MLLIPHPQTELAINTHVTISGTHAMVTDIHRTIVQGQERSGCGHSPVGNSTSHLTDRLIGAHRSAGSGQVSGLNNRRARNLTSESSIPGELPPPPPRAFFGRNELIEKIIHLAEDIRPIALIGAGGIGKTSIALTALHHDRIKQRFGHDRRFIRCDQFPASRAHFLRRLSNVIGASVENPEDLSPLRAPLSSKEMLIVLDNAESILDPQGTDAGNIYAVVEELSRFSNLCILITSRISTTPPDCEHFDIPTLSMNAARDTFYRIYGNDNRSDVINGTLEQLDLHPLSITLLATVARQNKWTIGRLTREWGQRRTSMLKTEHSSSLATTIELSLASPLFRQLGPDARALLEVVAFLPQGVDENNLEWLFPMIPDRADIFNKFCTLSLTYRNGEFVTMLAPLRDYLSPKDPMSSSLLRTVKERYFSRMSVYFEPNDPGFAKTRWITSEDVNVEHLLDVFTTVDAGSKDIWEACSKFMEHLYWHKKRLTILGPKIEGLPDSHSSKPGCLFDLGWLSTEVGNRAEGKRLLTHTLELLRERGDDLKVAEVLRFLCDVNRLIGAHKEGIEQAREAVEINERFGDTKMQVFCQIRLAFLLLGDKQLDEAEEAASRAIDLIGEQGNQFQLCELHRALGATYKSKNETEKAISHYKTALETAISFNWNDILFWTHLSLAELFRDDERLEDAQAHVEHAKSYPVNSAFSLGRAAEMQASIRYREYRSEEAESEALRALDIYEKHGAASDLERCRELLRMIQEELNAPSG